jgi:hypothetical protein
MGFSLLLLSPLTRYGKFGKQKKGGKEELGLRHKHESFLGDCHWTGFLLKSYKLFFFFFWVGGSNREKKAIKTWVSFLETYTELQTYSGRESFFGLRH